MTGRSCWNRAARQEQARDRRRCSTNSSAPGSEPRLRKVGLRLDDHLAAVAVWPGDPPDDAPSSVASASSPRPRHHGAVPDVDSDLLAVPLAGRRGERPQGRGRAPLTADHRPTSPGAIVSSTSVVPRCSDSVTRTSSGWSVSARASDLDDAPQCPSRSLLAGRRRGRGRLRRLDASGGCAMSVRTESDGCAPFLQPVLDACLVDLDNRRLRCAGCSGRGSRRSGCRARP